MICYIEVLFKASLTVHSLYLYIKSTFSGFLCCPLYTGLTLALLTIKCTVLEIICGDLGRGGGICVSTVFQYFLSKELEN